MPLKRRWGAPVIGGVPSQAALDYHAAFELLQGNLERDLQRIWLEAQKYAGQQQRMFLTNVLWELQQVYGGDAASLAVDLLGITREGKELPLWKAQAALLEQVDAAVGMALAKPDSQALLTGAMQRLVMNAYRDTVIGSAIAAQRRFARVAEPNACSFCLMLASRGAVYLSKERASYVGASAFTKHYSDGSERGYRMKTGRIRGSRPRDSKFHDNCKCHVVEVKDESQLPESSKWLMDAWGRATGDVDGMKGKQAAWSDWLKENSLPWEPKRKAA